MPQQASEAARGLRKRRAEDCSAPATRPRGATAGDQGDRSSHVDGRELNQRILLVEHLGEDAARRVEALIDVIGGAPAPLPNLPVIDGLEQRPERNGLPTTYGLLGAACAAVHVWALRPE